MPTDNQFHWVDYLIFILLFVFSAAIGIFYAWRDKRKENTDNFLLGGRNMSVIPVAMSLLASFLSAVSVLGIPTEVFYNGTMYFLFVFATILSYPVTAHFFVPVFHNLQLKSAYEYLELRFNFATRILGSIIFQVQMVLYMGIVLYAPAIAINQVMGINLLVSILATGAVCTFYTTIGGLKAVIWTDVFQTLVMVAGMLAVAIKGTVELGGFNEVWNTAMDGHKIELDNFDPNPLVRHTFWTLVVGGFFNALSVQAANQTLIQRYLSMNTIKDAAKAIYLKLPPLIFAVTLLTYTGLVLYARYHDHDPLQECKITKRDQLVPWLVMDVLGDFHGIPGLIVACIFSASLSTISSGVNALALVLLVDIVKPLYAFIYKENLSEKRATKLAKIFGMVYGGVAIGLAFSAEHFGNLILQMTSSLFGMVGGPLLGLFVCAMFFPIVNSWGAIVGVLCGLGMTIWVGVGTLVYYPTADVICTADKANLTTTFFPPTASPDMQTTFEFTSSSQAPETNEFLDNFYSLSYMWYSGLGVVTTVIVGLFVSCISGGTRGRPVDQRLLSPLYLLINRMSQLKTEDTPSGESKDTLYENI